ncbi:MAG: hypothetical protein HKN16_06545, partial [Saprospiraceae bacterium]|nr:hypothetical protein [Saprospiraceae bacterium]
IYTTPFLIFLIWASQKTRNNPWRRKLNWIGIAISSAYLLFGVYHNFKVKSIAEKALVEKGVEFNRFMVSPTILNNYLWNVVAEGDTAYYQTLYSVNDRPATLGKPRIFPKNHHLTEKYDGERPYEILKWFSNGYYSIMKRRDGLLQFNDMRFGTFGDVDGKDEDHYIFRFALREKDGELEAFQPVDEGERDIRSAFLELLEGIKGRNIDDGPGFRQGPVSIPKSL